MISPADHHPLGHRLQTERLLAAETPYPTRQHQEVAEVRTLIFRS